MQKIRFLCPHHRQQLSQQGLDAIEILNKWLSQADLAQVQADWQHAYRYYGSCMDLAEALIGLKPENESDKLTIHTAYYQAGLGLLRVFANTQNEDWWHFYQALIQQQLQHWLELASHDTISESGLRFSLRASQNLSLKTCLIEPKQQAKKPPSHAKVSKAATNIHRITHKNHSQAVH